MSVTAERLRETHRIEVNVIQRNDDSAGNEIKKHDSYTCLRHLMLMALFERLQYLALSFIRDYFDTLTWFCFILNPIKWKHRRLSILNQT